MKTAIKIKSSQESNYKLIEFLISQSDITANEEEGNLIYEKGRYNLRYKLVDGDFDLEFDVDGEAVELFEPELDLLYMAVEKEMDNERINSRYDDQEEPYHYATHNAY